MLSRLQHYVEGFFGSTASVFKKAGFTPNTVTVLGFFAIGLSSLCYGIGLAGYSWMLAVLLLLFAGYFDAIDGAMARRYHETSKVGGVLDSVLDRLGEILVYFGIAVGGLVVYPVALWALAASLMVSYVRARVEVEGVTLKGIGIAERPERLLIILVATLIYPIYNTSIFWGTLIVAAIASLTVGERLYSSTKMLGSRNR